MSIHSIPDLVIKNANVITIDKNLPKAESFAIKNGKFIAIGSNSDIENITTSNTKIYNAENKTIIPGLIDAHIHVLSSGIRHVMAADCSVDDITTVSNLLKKQISKTPKGEWVQGFKYDDTKTKEKRFINNKDLDEVAPNHPVIIRHRGGHTAYVNSMALSLAKIYKNSPDPEGGHIEKDAISGELTGRLLESATSAIENLIPNKFTKADYQEGAKIISDMMAKTGITSVTDAGTGARSLQSYQDAHEHNELKTRIYCMIRSYAIDEIIQTGKKKWIFDFLRH